MRHIQATSAQNHHAPSSKWSLLALATIWSCCGCVSTLAEDFQKSNPRQDASLGIGTSDGVSAGAWSTIVEMMPAAGATDVALDVDVRLTFDRKILPGEGSVSLRQTINQAITEVISIGDSRISIRDRNLVIDWDAELSPATGYYLHISPGAVLDDAGLPFAGLIDADAYRFSTRSPERLRVTSTYPTDGDTDVSPDTPLSFTFNQPIVAGLGGNITVTNVGTEEAFASISVADESRVCVHDDTLDVQLGRPLAYDERYRVTIDPGTVQSLGGSTFDGLDVGNPVTFTTMPPPVLTLVGTVPMDEETNVDPATSLVFTFAEEIVPGNGAITIHQVRDNAVVESVLIGDANVVVSGITLTVDLTSDLETSMEYYVTTEQGVVLSAAGAVFPGVSNANEFSFTTANETTTPLTMVMHSPSTGDIEVAPGTDLSLVFSERVSVGAGTVAVFTYDSDELVKTINVANSTAVSIVEDSVTISLDSPLADSTTHYVTVGAGSFRSLSGASFAGLSQKDAWYFTTESVFGIEETAPTDDARGVPTGADLAITFSDDVVIGTGVLEVRRVGDDAVVESVAIDGPQVRAEGRNVAVTLRSILASETDYYVVMDASTISAASGESWAGLSDPTRWNFTTEAVEFPGGTEAGLVLWVDAAYAVSIVEDGGVALWADRSGKHNDFSQSNSEERPSLVIDGVNGMPALDFDGGDALVGTNIIEMGAYDGFIVWQANGAAGTDKATLFANDRNAQVNHGHPYGASRDAAQACVGQNCPDNSGWFTAKFEPPPMPEQPNLWNWGFDAITTTIFARVNGSAPVSQSGPTMVPWAPEAPPVLGNCGTPPCGFDGQIAEVVLYARTLRAEERGLVVEYLRQKWGFAPPSCDADERLGPNGSCYYLGSGPMDWAAARTSCQARGLGWDLATIRSQAEHDFVSSVLEVETAIGGTDADVDGTWRWVTDTWQFWNGDGAGIATNASFAAWDAGEPTETPNESCARYLQTDGGEWRWADYVCTDPHAYLCEGPAN